MILEGKPKKVLEMLEHGAMNRKEFQRLTTWDAHLCSELLLRMRDAGHVEIVVPESYLVITQEGRAALLENRAKAERSARKAAKAEPVTATGESVVQAAIRTQPNSIFSMGAR